MVFDSRAERVNPISSFLNRNMNPSTPCDDGKYSRAIVSRSSRRRSDSEQVEEVTELFLNSCARVLSLKGITAKVRVSLIIYMIFLFY